jgi:hypothetical protein
MDVDISQKLAEVINKIANAGITIEECSLTKEVVELLDKSFPKTLIREAGAG